MEVILLRERGSSKTKYYWFAIFIVFLIGAAGCTTMKIDLRRGENMLIHGYAAEGFEEVRSEFIKNFKRRGDTGAACSVYYKGEKVVDLWGGYKNIDTKEPWEEDTIIRTYSTTKGMSLLVLAHLHSRGLLEYGEKVAAYWPEFAKNGKKNITVEQLITQKSGLVVLDRTVKVSELDNHAELSKLLENAVPVWEPGQKQGYCAGTVGLYEQQLVLRIDPEGRTIGRYFQEEIAGPQDIEFYIGIPADLDRERLATLQMLSPSPIKGMLNFYKPPKGLIKQLMNPDSLFNKAFYVVKNDFTDHFDELQFEEPSGGGVGEARGLAKVYGMLAMGGGELGLSAETTRFLAETAPPSAEGRLDVVMGFESNGSRGGYLKPSEIYDFGSDSAFGFSGTGGSFAFADPEHDLGFAYFMSKMDYYGINDPRERALREAVYTCIRDK
jgi:CubicO group peptidase (beta-lactamase class C family)